MKTVKEIMSTAPVTLPPEAPVKLAAQAMRDHNIGAVLVAKRHSDELCGILTDRDLVVRCVASGEEAWENIAVDALCSHEMLFLSPDMTSVDAIQHMRDHAVRRMPVLDSAGRAIGMVSLGDLAMERDPDSLLGRVSAASANH